MARKGGFGDAMRKAEKLLSKPIAAGMDSAASALRHEIRAELSKPGHGILYGNHVASAPGEPPAPWRGDLRQSVHIEKMPDGQRRVVVGPHEAAERLEYGSVADNLLPRPYMRPAMARASKRLGHHFEVAARTQVGRDLRK
jgi:hypothetical protein